MRTLIVICFVVVMVTGVARLPGPTLAYTAPALATLVAEFIRREQTRLRGLRIMLIIVMSADSAILNLNRSRWHTGSIGLAGVMVACILVLVSIELATARGPRSTAS